MARAARVERTTPAAQPPFLGQLLHVPPHGHHGHLELGGEIAHPRGPRDSTAARIRCLLTSTGSRMRPSRDGMFV